MTNIIILFKPQLHYILQNEWECPMRNSLLDSQKLFLITYNIISSKVIFLDNEIKERKH